MPVFNEVRCVAEVVARLRATAARVPDCSFDIVCVDDGSTDGSGAVLDAIEGVRVIRHAQRQGYGASLRHAIDESEHPWVFIVDADNTYPVEDLPRFIDAAAGAAMVVGNRRGVGMMHTPLRSLARWTLRKLVWALTGANLDDLNSGMRLFRRDLFEEFRALLPTGFSFTTTITVSSLFRRYPVRYLDVAYGLRVGVSNIRPVHDFFGFARLILRIAARFDPRRLYLTAAAFGAFGCVPLALAGIASGRPGLRLASVVGAALVGALVAAGLRAPAREGPP